MKRRIRMGQYEFPKPEWADVSEEGTVHLMCILHSVKLHFGCSPPEDSVDFVLIVISTTMCNHLDLFYVCTSDYVLCFFFKALEILYIHAI